MPIDYVQIVLHSGNINLLIILILFGGVFMNWIKRLTRIQQILIGVAILIVLIGAFLLLHRNPIYGEWVAVRDDDGSMIEVNNVTKKSELHKLTLNRKKYYFIASDAGSEGSGGSFSLDKNSHQFTLRNETYKYTLTDNGDTLKVHDTDYDNNNTDTGTVDMDGEGTTYIKVGSQQYKQLLKKIADNKTANIEQTKEDKAEDRRNAIRESKAKAESRSQNDSADTLIHSKTMQGKWVNNKKFDIEKTTYPTYNLENITLSGTSITGTITYYKLRAGADSSWFDTTDVRSSEENISGTISNIKYQDSKTITFNMKITGDNNFHDTLTCTYNKSTKKISPDGTNAKYANQTAEGSPDGVLIPKLTHA